MFIPWLVYELNLVNPHIYNSSISTTLSPVMNSHFALGDSCFCLPLSGTCISTSNSHCWSCLHCTHNHNQYPYPPQSLSTFGFCLSDSSKNKRTQKYKNKEINCKTLEGQHVNLYTIDE